MKATTFIEVLKVVNFNNLTGSILKMKETADLQQFTGETGKVFMLSSRGILVGNHIIIYINSERGAAIYEIMQNLSIKLEANANIADAICSDPEGQLAAFVNIDE